MKIHKMASYHASKHMTFKFDKQNPEFSVKYRTWNVIFASCGDYLSPLVPTR